MINSAVDKKIQFICLGSGSDGNAYVFIDSDNNKLMIECGFRLKELTMRAKMNDVSLQDIKAVMVTHKHKDHSICLKDLANLGIQCYAPKSALNENLLNLENVKVIEDNHKIINVKDTNFEVLVFPVNHDVEAYGFAILENKTNESVLFINDTRYFNFHLKEIAFDYIFIECNHIRKQLEAIKKNAKTTAEFSKLAKYQRQSDYHLSLAGCKKFLFDMNLSKTKGIFLMHLSKELTNDLVLKTEIKETFNIETFICYSFGGIN